MGANVDSTRSRRSNKTVDMAEWAEYSSRYGGGVGVHDIYGGWGKTKRWQIEWHPGGFEWGFECVAEMIISIC